MKLTYFVTINPIEDISLLNILVNSLNYQTIKEFNVVFYNQTTKTQDTIVEELKIRPRFHYSFIDTPAHYFFGEFPIWDIHSALQEALDDEVLGEYIACLHMENMFDSNYTEQVIRVLSTDSYDILFANLSRTNYSYSDIEDLLDIQSIEEYDAYLTKKNFSDFNHWIFSQNRPFYMNYPVKLKNEFIKLYDFKFSKRLVSTEKGVTKLRHYYEDIYFIKRDFAIKYNWFLKGHDAYFEDIHINWRLAGILGKLTQFPVYFNSSKIYHIRHKKYYYQICDETFTEGFLKYKTEDIVLNTLQTAIKKYKAGELGLRKSLDYSRANTRNSGSIQIAFELRLKYLSEDAKNTLQE